MKQHQEAERAIYNVLLTELKSCSVTRDIQRGKKIHAKAVEWESDQNIYVVTALINMYAKCNSMVHARLVFDSVQKPSVVAWNALLLGYAKNGDGIVSLDLFSRMKSRGYEPDSVTYVAAIKACISLLVNGPEDCLRRGREIHSQIGSALDHYVQSTLIDMYAKSGSMSEAQNVFDTVKEPDVVSWTTMILGYAENGEGRVALEMFSKMKAQGCSPNSVTYVAVLKACTSMALNGCLEQGREIHSQIGNHLNLFVQSALIDMYAKSRSMVEAQLVFDSVLKPDVVSWNALLMGYANNGEGLAALEMFSRMKASGCRANSVTYVAVLKACALVGALALGRKFHLEINEVDDHLVTCLVDFYAKCGSMVEAREVFDRYPKKRNALSWTVLLAGYSSLGDSDTVFNLFDAMQDEGCQPDEVTFVSVLLCCSHAGLVEKGREYFEAMTVQYGVTPSVMHYTCMVDILGRANQLNEAVVMIQNMPCNPDVVIWRTLLGACCKWKNVKVGKSAFQSLMDIDKKDAYAYVVMAHLYGSVGMWEEQGRILEMRTDVGLLGQAYNIEEENPLEDEEQLCEGLKVHG